VPVELGMSLDLRSQPTVVQMRRSLREALMVAERTRGSTMEEKEERSGLRVGRRRYAVIEEAPSAMMVCGDGLLVGVFADAEHVVLGVGCG
jgi:hypothetical protein